MEKQVEGYDDQGNPIYWDPQPRVVQLGDGKYDFKWVGHSGRELTLTYIRPDTVDLIVVASVSRSGEGWLSYTYSVQNLTTSKQNLGGFDVLTLSTAAKPQKQPGIIATDPAYRRADLPPEERFGLSFAPLRGEKEIRPGQEATFVLVSPDLPGLVTCRAHADTLYVEGVGEEPPAVFDALMLRHDAWPRGYTIGPDERLAKMSLEERLKYLVEHLPQMLELGWIENQKVMQWYETSLKAGKAAEVRARAKADFNKKLITSEVLALMTYLTR